MKRGASLAKNVLTARGNHVAGHTSNVQELEVRPLDAQKRCRRRLELRRLESSLQDIPYVPSWCPRTTRSPKFAPPLYSERHFSETITSVFRTHRLQYVVDLRNSHSGVASRCRPRLAQVGVRSCSSSDEAPLHLTERALFPRARIVPVARY